VRSRTGPHTSSDRSTSRIPSLSPNSDQVSVKDFAQHIIFLFERAPGNDATLEPEHARKWQALWDQCVAPGNNLMADRMKILPYLSHGANFLMAKVVNNQPGQLAEALECQQFAGQGYVEVHVDIDAYKSASIFTKLAKAAVGMVYPHVSRHTATGVEAGRGGAGGESGSRRGGAGAGWWWGVKSHASRAPAPLCSAGGQAHD
jgi:hypothetical protein